MKDIIEKFKKETGYTLEERNGRLYYGYGIDLRGTKITNLPEGLTIGGYLDLGGTKITSLPKGLTVGSFLNLVDTKITSLPEGLIVGGSLDIRYTEIENLPKGLTVGGSLDLEGTKITSLPEGLTVGGSLYIEDTEITNLPEGLTVGGSICIEGTEITNTLKVKKDAPTLYQWRNNKYIKCDGIFNEVISHHGNIYKVKDIGRTKEYYLVGDGNGKWAHGDTIEEARNDLLYKISNRDKSKYEDLTLDSVLSYEEAIECYRVITGACLAGTKGFCENVLTKKEEFYSIKEIISLTKGQYGNIEFKKFFS